MFAGWLKVSLEKVFFPLLNGIKAAAPKGMAAQDPA
jgi:hypothetical protein